MRRFGLWPRPIRAAFFETVPEAGLNADLQTLNEQYNSADEYIGKYVFAVSLKMIGKRA